MPTERQSNASRANGAKSKGPVTPEGKRRSSQNARKTIDPDDLANYVCLEVENSVIFKNILADLEATLQPQDPFARTLVHTIALAHWRSLRTVQLETAGMQHQMRQDLSLPETEALNNATRAALAFRTLADTSKAAALLGRNEARHERQIARSFSMLMKWKASQATGNEPAATPSAPTPNPIETQEIPPTPPPPEPAPAPKSEPEPTPESVPQTSPKLSPKSTDTRCRHRNQPDRNHHRRRRTPRRPPQRQYRQQARATRNQTQPPRQIPPLPAHHSLTNQAAPTQHAKMKVSMEFEKIYEPQKFEPRWSQFWLESGIYHANPDAPGAPFSIAIPPPNVTGSLHMGHMLDHTIMDTAVRWHRMRGENVLWLPGVDHAGIATQIMVERLLAEDKITRQQLGRDEFLKRVWEWKEKYGGRITSQMKGIGDSVDWSREAFTMSPQLSRAVIEAFVRLHEKGLIYRGAYMVNWCPRCQTAISDLETVHQETSGSLWHIKYPVTGTDRFLTVATTRPETMVGDTAVAINANDARYFDLHGKTVTLPLMNREIPIILDDLADPAFGSGAVKVTPAHDPNDFEVGKRHNLPRIQVIDGTAHMNAEAGPYATLDRFEARKRIVADLDKLGLLEKVEPHTVPLGRCDRCKTVIEPLVSTQWFVKTKPMAEKALQAAADGSIKFIPGNWDATYQNWMTNIRDWCISRQLWWGHRIPAWHCANCQGVTIARATPEACEHCHSTHIEQDPDVLDTWFSSGLWPFSTLGWPDQTADLKAYYPTSLMITGFDILFFWVARMIMMGLELTEQPPFRVVHMHGLVRDADRQKMSKMKGNVIDPLDITARFGTDAVRISLLMGVAAGTDIVYTEEKLTSARSFANKIWNASRLLFMNMERSAVTPAPQEPGAIDTLEDRWMFSRLHRTADACAKAFENHRYHEVAETLWHFFWHDFCDWYVEIKKLRLAENSGVTNDWKNLLSIYADALRLLHPLMPFLTEELWNRLGGAGSISLQPYPQKGVLDEAAEREMDLLQGVITEARTLRQSLNLGTKPLEGTLYTSNGAFAVAQSYASVIEKLANLHLAIKNERAPKLEGAVRSTPEFDLLIDVPMADPATQRARLEKEIAQYEKLVADKDRQLNNEKFMSSAPPHVIAGLQEKRAEYRAQLDKSRGALEQLI